MSDRLFFDGRRKGFEADWPWLLAQLDGPGIVEIRWSSDWAVDGASAEVRSKLGKACVGTERLNFSPRYVEASTRPPSSARPGLTWEAALRARVWLNAIGGDHGAWKHDQPSNPRNHKET